MDWAHAPLHRTASTGSYFLTAGTYLKKHLLSDGHTRDALVEIIQTAAEQYNFILRGWVVLSNHYHLMVQAPEHAIEPFVRRVHSISAKQINAHDHAPGRRVWFQYWDKYITHETSYYARLNYIHQNPVHHGIVRVAEHYRWSSLVSFERDADPALAKTVRSFKTEKLKIVDNF